MINGEIFVGLGFGILLLVVVIGVGWLAVTEFLDGEIGAGLFISALWVAIVLIMFGALFA